MRRKNVRVLIFENEHKYNSFSCAWEHTGPKSALNELSFSHQSSANDGCHHGDLICFAIERLQ